MFNYLKILNQIFTADLLDEYPDSDSRRSLVQERGVYLKPGRDYGEYCTDQIEETALELHMLGKLDDENGGIDKLRKQIEDRNPHTKIFQEGIVKVASKSPKKSYNYEQIISNVMNPLRERRDYGEDGKDFIEKQVMGLDELPKDLEEAMKRRKK